MSGKADIVKLSRRYIRQSLCISFGMFLLSLFVINVFHFDYLLTPVIVSFIFSIVVDVADAVIWGKVASNHAESLPTFYTAVSGFRMLLALAVMFAYYLICGSDSMLTFFLVFMAFYLMLLLHHSIFFARVSKRS